MEHPKTRLEWLPRNGRGPFSRRFLVLRTCVQSRSNAHVQRSNDENRDRYCIIKHHCNMRARQYSVSEHKAFRLDHLTIQEDVVSNPQVTLSPVKERKLLGK